MNIFSIAKIIQSSKYCIFILMITVTPFITFGQAKITMHKGSFKSYGSKKETQYLEFCADSALIISSAIYNSQDFKDSLLRLVGQLGFLDSSNCGCNKEITKNIVNGRINGDFIWRLIFEQPDPKIGLRIKKHSGALGVTKPCKLYITSFTENILSDMPDYHSLAKGLSVNICHEYMHSLGFCHPHTAIQEKFKREDGVKIDLAAYWHDVAYRVGMIAYDILTKWTREGKKYPYIN